MMPFEMATAEARFCEGESLCFPLGEGDVLDAGAGLVEDRRRHFDSCRSAAGYGFSPMERLVPGLIMKVLPEAVGPLGRSGRDELQVSLFQKARLRGERSEG
jgi:hypothetical protein